MKEERRPSIDKGGATTGADARPEFAKRALTTGFVPLRYEHVPLGCSVRGLRGAGRQPTEPDPDNAGAGSWTTDPTASTAQRTGSTL